MLDDLEIPDFLVRKQTEAVTLCAEPRRKRQRATRLRGNWEEFYLTTELPRIGSGIRLVEVISVGRKWVVLRPRDLGTKVKVSREAYDGLKRRSVAEDGTKGTWSR